jgi:glycosyltransferase involved in cell wall biosynthesis
MKQYCVISCPILTNSGYGQRTRDLVKAIVELKSSDWNIKVLAQRWGSTTWLKPEGEHAWIAPLILPQLDRQPDVWMQVTVPNEFQPVGKYNIGFTAGIETTLCDASWLEGVNRMNVTYVSSEHAKRVFKESSFEQRDNRTGQVIKHIKLDKPVEVLFEGIDLSKYKCVSDDELEGTKLVETLDEVDEDYLFLVVGHWLQGEFGEDRKNIGLTIKLFLDAFKAKKGKKPAMVLKTSHGPASVTDREEVLKKISEIIKISGQDLPNVYLLHGEFTDEDMNNLYNHPKVKAMISLTKGEGYGRPLAEFTQAKKPIIVSAWSGHLDFLKPENTTMLPGELKPLHPSAVVPNMLLAESKWFNVNHKAAIEAMKDMYENHAKHIPHGKQLAHHVKTNYSYDKMKEKLAEYLDIVPKQVALKLPKLSKIQLPQLNLNK